MSRKKIGILLIVAVFAMLLVSNVAAAKTATHFEVKHKVTSEPLVEDYDMVFHADPFTVAPYYASSWEDEQPYYGADCGPEEVSCVKGTVVDGRTVADLALASDPTFTMGYNNAVIEGMPSGWGRTGPNTVCLSAGERVDKVWTARFSEEFDEAGGADTAVGSSGLGVWNNPILAEPPYFDFAADSVFFMWSDFEGFSLQIMSNGEFTLFERVKHVDMNSWNTYRIEIYRFAGKDRVRFSVQNPGGQWRVLKTKNYPVGTFDCFDEQDWDDHQAYDRNFNYERQNLPEGETQHLWIDSHIAQYTD